MLLIVLGLILLLGKQSVGDRDLEPARYRFNFDTQFAFNKKSLSTGWKKF